MKVKTSMKYIAIVFMILAAATANARVAPTDTLDIYGGPDTLEGKFQTQAGEPDVQGWVGVDDTVVPPITDYWNVSKRFAENLAPGVPENHAWWCGQDMPACSPSDSAWGYGDDWNTALGTARTIDPAIEASLNLTGILNFDLEPGYDFLLIEAMTATGPVELLALDGSQLAYNLNVSYTFQTGEFVGEAGDEVQVRLHVVTDGGWSDADCSYPTAGAVQADNLSLAVSQPNLPPYPEEIETCEPGEPLTWGPVSPVTGVGNFAQLWSGLDDMDPENDNHSPQWAFINDGIIVPELDPSYCWDKCYGPDSLSVYTGPEGLRNSILSPPIGLPDDWTGTLHLAFDAYQDPAECKPMFLKWAMHATDDPAGEADWVETWFDFLLYDEGPSYQRLEFPIDQEMVPSGTRYVRIKLQAHQLAPSCWGPMDSPAPYLDNVRLQLVPESPSHLPESPGFLVSAGPNPFNPAVVISWDLPRAEELKVNLHDVRGRLVCRLCNGPAPAGRGQISWEGRDDAGYKVASGVYFCSFQSNSGSRLLKLTLMK